MGIMNWKHFLIIGLICFGLGVIVGYVISGYPTPRVILNLVPVALAILGGLEVVSIVRDLYKEKSKKKGDHSKKLVDKELKLITNTFIGSSDDYNLKLCIEGRQFATQTYDVYSNEVAAHLEKGYSEVWKHKIKCDSFIDNHNDLAKILLDITKEEILKQIKKRNLSLIEWDGRGQSPINYFLPEYLFKDVGYVIQSSYERSFDIDQYCTISQSNNNSKSTTNGDILNNVITSNYPEYCNIKWKLTIISFFAESSNKTDIEELKQIIKETLNVILAKDDFGRLKKYKNYAEGEHRSFLKGIADIIKNIENDIPLNGKCEICKKY